MKSKPPRAPSNPNARAERRGIKRTISLSRFLAREGARRAREEHRPFSNYIARLIEKDSGIAL